jgi:hypothetical protein
MSLTYSIVANTLVALDPFRRVWGPHDVVIPRGAAALRASLEPLRRSAGETASVGLSDIAHHVGRLDPARAFGVFPDVPRPGNRHPVVLAHGPSLRELVGSLRAHRDRLYIVAPFRTALRLASDEIIPDVVVLADGIDGTSELSIQAWQTTPAEQRRALETQATLLTGSLPPAVIHGGFARATAFDDGLGWPGPEAALPFWGSALLPSICVPLALGARSVAIGGMDMTATSGRPCRNWNGESLRLDPKLRIAHRLLEVVASALPARMVDLSGNSVTKRGFERVELDAVVAQAITAPRSAAEPPRRHVRGAGALDRVLSAADGFATTVAAMSATGARTVALCSSGNASPDLAAVVEQMERNWMREPDCRAAVLLLQPPYLRALWRLREAGISSRNPAVSTLMKARLVGPEIAGLEGVYHEWLAAIRHAVDAGTAPAAAPSDAQAC